MVLPGPHLPRSALLTAADKADRGVALLCQGVLLVTGVALMGVLTANVVARYVLATGGFAEGSINRLKTVSCPWRNTDGTSIFKRKSCKLLEWHV